MGKLRSVLRCFWLAYAVLMIAAPIALVMFLHDYMYVLPVSGLGVVLFWAARDAAQERRAAVMLQCFCVFVALDCIGALALGDLIPEGLSLFLLAVSLLSLVVWRGKAAEPAPDQE